MEKKGWWSRAVYQVVNSKFSLFFFHFILSPKCETLMHFDNQLWRSTFTIWFANQSLTIKVWQSNFDNQLWQSKLTIKLWLDSLVIDWLSSFNQTLQSLIDWQTWISIFNDWLIDCQSESKFDICQPSLLENLTCSFLLYIFTPDLLF